MGCCLSVALLWTGTTPLENLFPLVPLRPCLVLWQGEEEDVEAGEPEGSQAGVVDAVEHCDLCPGERGPGEHLPGVGVPDHVAEGLPSRPVPAHWLDGGAAESLRFRSLPCSHPLLAVSV